MKKVLLFILVLLAAVIAFSSCSKTDTYADKLKKERNAINSFIDSHDIDVLTQFPEKGVFEKNQFFKDANTGVYFRVENMGSGDTVRLGTTVNLRLGEDNILLVSNDTLRGNDDLSTVSQWIALSYGVETTYQNGILGTDATFTPVYLSPACILPLKYKVCNKGVVSMIIPFSSGSTMQQNGYYPLYIKQMRYTYNND